jgi:hypothetical protein
MPIAKIYSDVLANESKLELLLDALKMNPSTGPACITFKPDSSASGRYFRVRISYNASEIPAVCFLLLVLCNCWV